MQNDQKLVKEWDCVSEGVCVDVKAFGLYSASSLNPEMIYLHKFCLFFYLCLEMVCLGKSLPLVCCLHLHIKRYFYGKVHIKYMTPLPEMQVLWKYFAYTAVEYFKAHMFTLKSRFLHINLFPNVCNDSFHHWQMGSSFTEVYILVAWLNKTLEALFTFLPKMLLELCRSVRDAAISLPNCSSGIRLHLLIHFLHMFSAFRVFWGALTHLWYVFPSRLENVAVRYLYNKMRIMLITIRTTAAATRVELAMVWLT